MQSYTRGLIEDPIKKRDYNRALFKTIASCYNSATVLLSFHRDKAWKKFLVSSLPDTEPGTIVDLACGTGDITSKLRARYKNSLIVGLDLTKEMLQKAKGRAIKGKTVFSLQDMSMAAIATASVDLLTGGYALRNSPDLSKTISEIRRILKPGGTAAFLDFSKPSSPLLQKTEILFLQLWGAIWGLLLRSNPDTFMYIARSLRHFPHRHGLHEKIRSGGFEILRSKLFFGGIVEVLIARKENE